MYKYRKIDILCCFIIIWRNINVFSLYRKINLGHVKNNIHRSDMLFFRCYTLCAFIIVGYVHRYEMYIIKHNNYITFTDSIYQLIKICIASIIYLFWNHFIYLLSFFLYQIITNFITKLTKKPIKQHKLYLNELKTNVGYYSIGNRNKIKKTQSQ